MLYQHCYTYTADTLDHLFYLPDIPSWMVNRYHSPFATVPRSMPESVPFQGLLMLPSTNFSLMCLHQTSSNDARLCRQQWRRQQSGGHGGYMKKEERVYGSCFVELSFLCTSRCLVLILGPSSLPNREFRWTSKPVLCLLADGVASRKCTDYAVYHAATNYIAGRLL